MKRVKFFAISGIVLSSIIAVLFAAMAVVAAGNISDALANDELDKLKIGSPATDMLITDEPFLEGGSSENEQTVFSSIILLALAVTVFLVACISVVLNALVYLKADQGEEVERVRGYTRILAFLSPLTLNIAFVPIYIWMEKKIEINAIRNRGTGFMTIAKQGSRNEHDDKE